MYILTVLLHKKNEMDTKSQTDEMSRHRHYRGELSFRRKKDLRCTAHTTISLSSRVMSMFKKKKKKGLPFTTEGKPTSSKDYKKWLGGCSQYSHTHTHSHLDYTGLGSINTYSTVLHRFKLYKEFWETSYFKSFHQDREIMISWLFSFITQPFPNSYCTTGQSDPLKATMVT